MSSSKKNLLLTYDYELFLGNRSGKVSECLIHPTNDTLKILNQYKVKGIFFVDTVYLIRLNDHKNLYPVCGSDFELISRQLQNLVKSGHYVFIHIHPHWLDADYLPEINEWKLSNIERYRFHNCDESTRQKLFDDSMHIIKEIIAPVDAGYKPDCFRAGGWGIQPFSDFKNLFARHKIQYDMSVQSGFYSFTDAQFFDFTKAPVKCIYRFGDNECEEMRDGAITEFTISSIEPGIGNRMLNKIFQKFLHKFMDDPPYLRGQGQESNKIEGMKAPESGYDILETTRERIGIEMLNPFKLGLYKKYLSQNDYMHFISHPKMIAGFQQRLFAKFLEFACSNYSIESDFRKMDVP